MAKPEYEDKTEYIMMLADKLADTLKKNLPLPPDTAAPGIECATRIRDEINSYGFLVEWEARINPAMEVYVVVYVKKPKENMNESERAIYRAWLAQHQRQQ